MVAGAVSGRAWLAALPEALGAQRRVMTGLVDLCEDWPLATSLLHHIWQLWAAAQGALYPWHGLSQVLDHDPGDLPPGIESTVAGLDAAGLRRAARASAVVLAAASEATARRHPADLPLAMADYVTRRL